jgi:hypothetical protein
MSKPNPHKHYSKSTYSSWKKTGCNARDTPATQEANPQSHVHGEETLALQCEVR